MQLDWSHAFIQVKSLETMLDFYVNILGFKISDRTESLAFLTHLEDEHHQLAFQEVDHKEDTSNRIGHFAFRAASIQDVRSLYEQLNQDPKVKQVAPITHGNTWSIYFADPEKNGIEVFCDTPWDTEQPFSESWDPNLSDADLKAYTLGLLKERGKVVANRRTN